jgi:hypothetical protein
MRSRYRFNGSPESSVDKSTVRSINGAPGARSNTVHEPNLAEQDEWHRLTEEFGTGPSDDLTDALAGHPGFMRYVADLIAAEYLADVECGRKPCANGTYKPRLPDDERDAIAARIYGEIRR